MSQFSYNRTQHPFFDTLQKRVYQYFEDKQIDMTGGSKLMVKAIFFILAAAVNYWLLLFVVPIGWWSVLLCMAMGFLLAAIGFNIMHDGAHGSFSKYDWLNNLMGMSLNVMGGDVNLWKIKHNLIHHSFTNVNGMDDDINIEPYVRTNTFQKKYAAHRFQHWYVTFLYALTYLNWIGYADFEKYFTNKVGDIKFKKLSWHAHLAFWVGKLGFITMAFVVPVVMFGFLKTIVGFAIITFTCGILLALVFQVAHVVEETSFLSGDDKKTEDEWAVTQLKGTANFSTHNPLMLFLTGGLNHQIEHHLFPRISHVHYPAISEIVRSTAKEFGIQYHEYRTFFSAVASHYAHLRAMGVA